jgi:predicted lipoprotein with Yx(FWY)xxD motif
MERRSDRQLRRTGMAALVTVAGAAGMTAAVAEAMTSHGQRATKQGQTTIGVKQEATLGQILDAGSQHLSVYIFAGDSGTKSSCSGACAKAWPPVTTVAQPKASGGARSSDLTTVRRHGGVTQVTYRGHPLYYFEGDRTAKSAAGEDIDAFGARRYVISPSGRAVKRSTSASATGTPMPGAQTTPTTESQTTPATTTPTTTTGSQTTPTNTTPTTTTPPPDEWS